MFFFEPSRVFSCRRWRTFSSSPWKKFVRVILPSAFSLASSKADQAGQVGRIAEAFHVGLGEAHVAVEQDAAEEAPVPDVDLGVRRRIGLAEACAPDHREAGRSAGQRSGVPGISGQTGRREGMRSEMKSTGHEPRRRCWLADKISPASAADARPANGSGLLEAEGPTLGRFSEDCGMPSVPDPGPRRARRLARDRCRPMAVPTRSMACEPLCPAWRRVPAPNGGHTLPRDRTSRPGAPGLKTRKKGDASAPEPATHCQLVALLAMSASTSVSQNQRSPARQSISRSLVRKEAVTMRTRLCIQPVRHSSRMPASTMG